MNSDDWRWHFYDTVKGKISIIDFKINLVQVVIGLVTKMLSII